MALARLKKEAKKTKAQKDADRKKAQKEEEERKKKEDELREQAQYIQTTDTEHEATPTARRRKSLITAFHALISIHIGYNPLKREGAIADLRPLFFEQDNDDDHRLGNRFSATALPYSSSKHFEDQALTNGRD